MMRAVVIAIFALGAVATSAATAQVYKCTQEGGRILYSDNPCKGGAVVDVNAGAANPVAISQLARDNAAFDHRMDARRFAEDGAAIQQAQMNARLEAAQGAQSTADGATKSEAYYYDPAYGFVDARRVKRHTHPHKVTRAPERRVPAKPASPSVIGRTR